MCAVSPVLPNTLKALPSDHSRTRGLPGIGLTWSAAAALCHHLQTSATAAVRRAKGLRVLRRAADRPSALRAHQEPARRRPHMFEGAALCASAPLPTRLPWPRTAVAMWRRCELPGCVDAVTLPAPAQRPSMCALVVCPQALKAPKPQPSPAISCRCRHASQPGSTLQRMCGSWQSQQRQGPVCLGRKGSAFPQIAHKQSH